MKAKARRRPVNGSPGDEVTQVTKMYADAMAYHERVRTKTRSIGVKAEALSLHLADDDETEHTPTDPQATLPDEDTEGN